jgi:hypothetical protein
MRSPLRGSGRQLKGSRRRAQAVGSSVGVSCGGRAGGSRSDRSQRVLPRSGSFRPCRPSSRSRTGPRARAGTPPARRDRRPWINQRMTPGPPPRSFSAPTTVPVPDPAVLAAGLVGVDLPTGRVHDWVHEPTPSQRRQFRSVPRQLPVRTTCQVKLGALATRLRPDTRRRLPGRQLFRRRLRPVLLRHNLPYRHHGTPPADDQPAGCRNPPFSDSCSRSCDANAIEGQGRGTEMSPRKWWR